MVSQTMLAANLAAYQTNGVELCVAELVRYRHHTKALDLSPSANPQAQLSGSYISRIKGRGMEFDESRHYQPGDDIRAIDWRVTARTGKTHTKVFREERERPVYVLTDMSKTMQFGSEFVLKSVQAAHLAALIAWSAIERGDKLGSIGFNDEYHLETKPRNRQAAVLAVLHHLLELQNRPSNHALKRPLTGSSSSTSANSFYDACARLVRLAKPGSLVWLVSDFQQLDTATTRLLTNLSRHCEVRAAVINDPLELHLPDSVERQSLTVTDGVNNQSLVLGDKQSSQEYHHWASSRQAHIIDSLESAKVHGFAVSAGTPLLDHSLQPLRTIVQQRIA
ncbi:DUF58 domain-containing protein [Alteromonas sp. ASW11-36]|uniref:DUF58 domain-containing protein n=1 Tax=Alteromonas arenosi TaxID=3055817 RepID=A0ABT7SUX1_9ALTE|nr:DUF58 domain-containing protein [Alteromonas sp. ASW11-36]MDM7859990.1 DUF58 domain-containing protein [Alteromonas sp. ASW11-36]